MTPLDWWRRDGRTAVDNLPASEIVRIDVPTPAYPVVDRTEPTCPAQLPEADRRKPAPEWMRGSRVGMCNHLRWQPRMPGELRDFIRLDSRHERGEE